MSHSGCALVWHVQPRVVIFPCRTNYRPSSVKCRSRRRWLAIWMQQWRFQQHFHCACAETVIYEFLVKFLTSPFDIARHRFPLRESEFLAIWAFSIHFCFSNAESPVYFYFRFGWPTDQESVWHVWPHDDNWSWYDHPLPSYSILLPIRYVNLWPWPLTFWP